MELNSARIDVLAYTFLFFGTAASFSQKNQKAFRLQLSNQNATPFYFCPKVNSAMLFRDMQPIKLQKRRYSDFEYMLKSHVWIELTGFSDLNGFH